MTVSKHQLGREVSGNPAKRAAMMPASRSDELIVERLALAADLWPFAFDFYTQSGRVGLFADVPVIETDAAKAVDLHGTTTVPLGSPGRRVDADRFGGSGLRVAEASTVCWGSRS